MAGKVSVGLAASHWSCFIASSGLSIHELSSLVRDMKLKVK